jgi:hypothetical protein
MVSFGLPGNRRPGDGKRYAANTTDNLKLPVLRFSLSVQGDEQPLAIQGVDASSR